MDFPIGLAVAGVHDGSGVERDLAPRAGGLGCEAGEGGEYGDAGRGHGSDSVLKGDGPDQYRAPSVGYPCPAAVPEVTGTPGGATASERRGPAAKFLGARPLH